MMQESSTTRAYRCPFGCVRVDEAGRWWLLGQRKKGWNSFGCAAESQAELEAREGIRLVMPVLTDEWGEYYEYEKILG